MMSSSKPGANGRKLVIKPFKVQPKVPENYADETWLKLKSAIQAVYEKNASSMSKEELYRGVEDLCLHKYAARLYEDLHAELKKHIEDKVRGLANQTSDSGVFLQIVETIWQDHCEQLTTIRNIFLYLDRSYALQPGAAPMNHAADSSSNGNITIRPIWDLGHFFFRQCLDTLPEVQAKIITCNLHIIELIRRGDNSFNTTISRITHMLLTLQMYFSHFEGPFLSASKAFFTLEGNQAVQNLDVPHFLLLVDKRLAEITYNASASNANTAAVLTQPSTDGAESSTVSSVTSAGFCVYIDTTTIKALCEVIYSALLVPHVHTLMEKGFSALLEENKIDDLRRFFVLLEKVNLLDVLKNGWNFYIRLKGEGIVNDTISSNFAAATSSSSNAAAGGSATGDSNKASTTNTANFVEDVLQLLDRLEIILKKSFYNKAIFSTAMKSAFEHFLNIHQKVTAEQLARYVDKKLRGEKGVTESEVEQRLESSMKVFHYLNEKDIFEAFYKKHLAKRLLLNKSASADLERSMLSKLKAECGSQYTAKLEGMFNDVELSRQVQQAYVQHCQNKTYQSKSEVSMEVQVLATGFWPTNSNASETTVILPPELALVKNRFTQFYTNAYQGRRLTWSHSLERCLVSARFPKGKKDLEVSLYQAVVLACFNKEERFNFVDIKRMTGLEDDECRRTLQSLACGMIGTRVLTKEPKGKDVLDTDIFLFNTEFVNKLFRIKINTIQAKEQQDEVQKTHEEVFRDREYQVDAAVVRIMKARKRLSHTMLMSEVMSQLRFPAQNADIKKRIESLIERDYLERDPDENAFYRYLA